MDFVEVDKEDKEAEDEPGTMRMNILLRSMEAKLSYDTDHTIWANDIHEHHEMKLKGQPGKTTR